MRLRALMGLLVVLAFAGCEFQHLSGDYACEAGDTRANAKCVDGFWVASGPSDMNEGKDMNPQLDMPPGDSGTDMCVPETNSEFCARLNLSCDSVTATDNCGGRRSTNCGTCASPAVCGGGGTPNVCACSTQTDKDFCDQNSAECGALTAMDECSISRTVDCATCAGCTPCVAPETCGGGGAANTCGCTPMSETEFCTAQGANCGALSGDDGCGGTISANCGSCTEPASCAAAGTPNVCECPSSPIKICETIGAACGDLDVTGNCSNITTVNCGSCVLPETCGSVTANQCDCGTAACDPYSCGTLMPAGCTNDVNCAGCGNNQSCSGNTCFCDDCSDGACFVGQQCDSNNGDMVCSPSGTCCTPESDAALCTAGGYGCGKVTVTDNCGASREIDCGGCNSPETCGAVSANQCACDVSVCGDFCGTRYFQGCRNLVACSCGSGQNCIANTYCRCNDCSDSECSPTQWCGGNYPNEDYCLNGVCDD